MNPEYVRRGNNAENRFKMMAQQKQYQVEHASEEQDMNEHWDWKITNQARSYKIDVKAMKKICKTEKDIQDKYAWIELHGVRATDNGWLFDGKADLIAFETAGSFVLVHRLELMKYVNGLDLLDCTRNKSIEEIKPKRIYNRAGRCDKIIMVPIEELRSIKFDEWSL